MIQQLFLLHSFVSISISRAEDSTPVDPHQWLEAVEDENALDWVKERNRNSIDQIASGDEFISLQKRLESIYNSEGRIPYVRKHGDLYYNFWRDEDHPRGVWRRTTLESYQSDSPEWEVILDLDELATTENENWVWHGAQCLMPEEIRCMI